jgi:hypothetical protein
MAVNDEFGCYYTGATSDIWPGYGRPREPVALWRFANRHPIFGIMNLDLTDEQAAALEKELTAIIEGDRYFLSPRIQMLRAIRNTIRPEPKREPLPEPKRYEPPSKGRYRRRQ